MTTLGLSISPIASSATTRAPHSPRSVARATLTCSPKSLFYAAVAKEHFNPNDPSYTKAGSNLKPTAYGVICRDRWAISYISRPNVGTTDGLTLFQAKASNRWVEVKELGYNDNACVLRGSGVPAKVAIVLARGTVGGPYCDLPYAYSLARTLWVSGRCSAPSQLIDTADGWPAVAQTLQESEPGYGGNPNAYKMAILNLDHIVTVLKNGNFLLGPGTDGTWLTSRDPTFRTDLTQLDSFLHTPKYFVTSTLPACYSS